MDADLEPVCRCGTERIVVHGGVAICMHCDQPCMNPKRCISCIRREVTCTCCRTEHDSSEARRKCEQVHTS